MACGTQWRGTMDGREGLDYAGVQIIIAQHTRPRWRKARLAEVQIMERSALQAWSELRQTTRELTRES